MLEPMSRGASLRERAKVAIRGGIITGEIEAGEIFSAPVLAKQLGVSATPVREAMLDLVTEGLVEAVPNRGFRVAPLREDDLDEIIELRILVEAPAVAALAGRPGVIDARAIKRLRGLANEIKKLAVAADLSLSTFIDADREFHVELLSLYGNRRLVELVERLRNSTHRYGLRQLSHETLSANVQEHHAILDALESGDRERTRALMEAHIRSNRGVLAGHDLSTTGAS